MDVMMVGVALLTAVIFGGSAGSLVHSISTRLPADQDPIGPPVCHNCGQETTSRNYIPLRLDHCPHCGAAGNWYKVATVIAAIGLTAVSLLVHGLTLTGALTAIFCLILLLILRIDWQNHLIFVITIVPSLAFVLGAAALQSQSQLLSAVVAGMGAGLLFSFFFLLALLIYRRQALGFGDILLVVLIGAITGIQRVVPAIFFGMLLAAFGGLFLVAIGKRTRQDYIPYGAYLCIGTIIILLLPR